MGPRSKAEREEGEVFSRIGRVPSREGQGGIGEKGKVGGGQRQGGGGGCTDQYSLASLRCEAILDLVPHTHTHTSLSLPIPPTYIFCRVSSFTKNRQTFHGLNLSDLEVGRMGGGS